MIKQFKNTLLLLHIIFIQLIPQSIGEQKFLEMKNSFILGLPERGFEIAAELMSRNDYMDVREDATFYIAEFFFTLASTSEDNTDYSSKAYTYYLVMQKEFPNSKYATTVAKRINTLITFYKNNALFRNLFDLSQNEAVIVEKKLAFTEELYTFKFPNPYMLFLEGQGTVSTSEVLSRYYDEIVINLPEFDIYAIYYKIISKLSNFDGINYLSDGMFKIKENKISKNQYVVTPDGYISKYDWTKASLDSLLNNISIKYPNHPLTLQLHLIFAQVFMQKIGGIIDSGTKKHLEFVIQNELDKTHPRYLLTREFLLNNKFN